MIVVKTEIVVNAPIELCFNLSRDIELHTRTVWKHTSEKAIDGVTSGKIGLGEFVTFQATHLGIRQKLTSQIVEYERPKKFVDQMVRGAFKSMRHIHEFEAREDQTVMKDTLIFEAPLGILGLIVERLILKKYMRRFLDDRNEGLKQIAESLGLQQL
ncbi:SRPBCC family protein [Paenibacillus sp. YYML68]|uniref:SRPBCC family protein n=1 Tax=Paenibacillus sp. YYML68 TaxID=2909250 RepID=UPI002492E138|nr:SRPBCC family protein [Paenibacillus sp. YYML68]